MSTHSWSRRAAFACLLLAACSAPPARPAHPEEQALVALCARFLDDYSNGRWEAVEAALAPNALSAHFDATRGTVEVVPMATFLARMKPMLARLEGFREWIVGTPRVVVDGEIASVWADFEVTSKQGGGSGVDVFHLVKLRDGWRIGALFDRFVAKPKG